MMKTLPENLTLPPRTLARPGALKDLLKEGRAFGRRGLLVHGRALTAGGALHALRAASPADVELTVWAHAGGEPTLDDVEAALAVARDRQVEWVAGAGGGSTMDVAKACAGLLHSPLPVRAYHDGAPIEESRTPFLAAPSTAGTGSEATFVSVLTNSATGVKKSFRHPSHMARLVLLDPELLATCPPAVIAHSGMDALVQAVESYISRGATGFSDMLAITAIRLIHGRLTALHQNARDLDAATDLLHGSYLAGLALSNARLGIVHGLAHPLGARYHEPHGRVCAACLPAALEFNRPAIGGKYEQMSDAVGSDLQEAVRRLTEALGIGAPFSGKTLDDRQALIRETLASGSTAANPRPVSAADVDAMLTRLFE